MYRERCRPRYSDDELDEIYDRSWQLEPDWLDHVQRFDFTERLAVKLINDTDRTAADLSAGDGYWSRRLPDLEWTLSDYVPAHQLFGPIEETIHQISPVDVFFCCETIEHLDDPDYILQQIRGKTKKLVLSTPKKYEVDINPEHYWSWDDEAVKEMLIIAGFNPIEYLETTYQPGYIFQIWGCM